MVDELQNFLATVTPEDHHSVQAAVDEYVQTIEDTDIHNEIRAAAHNAVMSGDGGATWQLKGLVNHAVIYGPVVKRATVRLLMGEPHILKYFSPQFTKGVLSRYYGYSEGHARVA